jgi:hypothetical protein
MAQLKWKDSPDDASAHKHAPSNTSVQTPWPAVAMGLIGVIVGYFIGNL